MQRQHEHRNCLPLHNLAQLYHFEFIAIPAYLQHEFISLITSDISDKELVHWRDIDLKTPGELKKAKQQLLNLILALDDSRLQQVAVWRCLNQYSFLGAIFYIEWGIKMPSISNQGGELIHVASRLNELIGGSDDIHIDNLTRNEAKNVIFSEFF